MCASHIPGARFVSPSHEQFSGLLRFQNSVCFFDLQQWLVPHRSFSSLDVSQRINYYDSMGGSGKSVTDSLLLWLEDEDEDKNGDDATFEPDDWTAVGTNVGTTPQQVWLRLIFFDTANGSTRNGAYKPAPT